MALDIVLVQFKVVPSYFSIRVFGLHVETLSGILSLVSDDCPGSHVRQTNSTRH
jgi:hypothetical protein